MTPEVLRHLPVATEDQGSREPGWLSGATLGPMAGGLVVVVVVVVVMGSPKGKATGSSHRERALRAPATQ